MKHTERLSPKLIRTTSTLGEVRLWHWCPACGCVHMVSIENPNGEGPVWEWDGNAESPTISPSVNYFELVCHYFLKAGQLEFLADCTHKLAGQTVPLPELKKGYLD